jgi:hypothetical protein
MVVVTGFFIFYENRKSNIGSFVRSAIALTAPLLVTGILLGWYNWARFDSILEFGLYYQLAAFNLQANYDALFSRVYVIQNIYNYFFNPFELKGTFPFAYPLAGNENPVFLSPELPKLYAVEGKFGGVFISTPSLVFAIIPFLMLLITFVKGIKNETRSALWNWTVASLIAAFIAGSIPTLLIFYVGFRYETEFVTSLTMLAMIGFCQSYMHLQKKSLQQLVTLVGATLAVFSVLVNLALSYNGVYG